ncbi:MAG: PASTA domain-containing protein [Bacteroidetes bacterium]|nr:PASTA domain-containing protein [Bacteroidota bacterium]
MPRVTRQSEVVSVPDFRGMPISEALLAIDSVGLVFGDTTSRIGPDSLQGLVAVQTPRPSASVRPRRRIYLSIYRGLEQDVVVPDVSTQSRRNARLALRAAGLIVHEEPDTIPSPDPGAVTRTDPVAGSLVPRGDSVTVWYGRGLNRNRLVEVPNVVGQHHHTADSLLRALFFWPRLLGQEGDPDNPLILRQSPEPGELSPEGSDIRLFTTADSLD